MKNWEPAERGFTFYYEIIGGDYDEFGHPCSAGATVTIEGLAAETDETYLSQLSQQLIESGQVMSAIHASGETGKPQPKPMDPEFFRYLQDSITIFSRNASL
jgi:hypothetical protein